GICQVFAHGVAKAALFMAVGNIIHALGTDRITSLHRIAGRMPLTTATLGLAGVSLMGLPPSGGFVAKWMTLNAVLASGQWWWVPVIVAGGLLTAGYVFLILGHAFRPLGQPSELQPIPKVMEVTALLLALSGIVLGFQAEELIELLGSGPFLSSIPGGEP
ncbi:MAG: proton-conducting transporter membrane subunit, partial [Desulfohalobiaceae bacterium]